MRHNSHLAIFAAIALSALTATSAPANPWGAAITDSLAPAEVCSGLLPIAVVPESTFQIGCDAHYSLRMGAAIGASFWVFDLPLCQAGVCAGMGPTGLSVFQCLMANGYGCCISTGDAVVIEPGNLAGPLVQSLQSRWSSDTDQRVGTCFADYQGNGERLLSVAVTTPAGPRSPITILAFATAWLVDRPQPSTTPEIHLEFLPAGTTAVPPTTWGQLRLRYR